MCVTTPHTQSSIRKMKMSSSEINEMPYMTTVNELAASIYDTAYIDLLLYVGAALIVRGKSSVKVCHLICSDAADAIHIPFCQPPTRAICRTQSKNYFLYSLIQATQMPTHH